MAIIALGVGFFTGIKATAPSMYNLAETYYSTQNLMDYRLLSTVGFDEDDIDAVSGLEGVTSVMPSYCCDVLKSAESGGQAVRIIALPTAYKNGEILNKLVLKEGRLPEKSGEIAVENSAFSSSKYKIGDSVKFSESAGETDFTDKLACFEFTVVGEIESPLYISYQRGSTTVGNGDLSEYMYILPADFAFERYTELYVKTDISEKYSAFSVEYESGIEEFSNILEAAADVRCEVFNTDVIGKAERELQDAKDKYYEETAKADKEFADAEQALKDGRAELDSQLADAQKALDDALARIESGSRDLQKATDEYYAQIAEAENAIAAKSAELDRAIEAYEASKAEFSEQIESAQAALDAAKAELEEQKSSGYAQLAAAKAELDFAQSQYDSAAAELNAQKAEGEEKLRDGQDKYDEQRAEAEEKFAEAKQKIADAEAELNGLSEPEWYVLMRDDNAGFSTFSQNADRLDSVASVFPVFFLLVAVLVCVITMTRLIEEKRTEIGTLKALGYSNTDIVMKFVVYSSIAGVAGSITGTAIGVSILPFVIYNAYKIMYFIGDIKLVLNVPSIILGIGAAVICTTAVSVIVCRRSLVHKPASIMRPKAPKPGKRILLEKITPLWSHMNFTAKLTSRNLLRYKARLCMTVIGVAGCCALVVAAFGLLNSFVPLTHAQFEDIYKYDAVVIPKESGTAESLDYLVDTVTAYNGAYNYMLLYQEDVSVKANGTVKDDGTSITVVQTPEALGSIISLHPRKEEKELVLGDNGVLINEKLSTELGLKVGSTVVLSSAGGEAEVRIDGIFEQYIYNYVYMSPALYTSLYGKEVEYNSMGVVLNEPSDSAESGFSTHCLKDSRIAAVSYVDTSLNDFRNMLNSLNMVVAVMIICAAALAFVVLYNLTNINIAERVREIATFKVLGFYNKETSAFIYIENIVLTILGIMLGLVLGIFLTGFIVQTVEVDNIMFGRDIFASTYFYAAGLTMLFSLLVLFVMSFKIKAVNMVESLKSVE